MPRKFVPFLTAMITFFSACIDAQPTSGKLVGGPCEGCEAIYEYSDRQLTPTVTLPDYDQGQPKLHISGTIFHSDGITPARDVILYIYHTNENGIYPARQGSSGWARRHGYIRGWLMTGPDGRYSIKTYRPASYPNISMTAHIHATIKEPNINEYYIDEFLFDDDPFLTEKERNSQPMRGGAGILKTEFRQHILHASRDIILGKNIPNYPVN